jgi:hypothetical protein
VYYAWAHADEDLRKRLGSGGCFPSSVSRSARRTSRLARFFPAARTGKSRARWPRCRHRRRHLNCPRRTAHSDALPASKPVVDESEPPRCAMFSPRGHPPPRALAETQPRSREAARAQGDPSVAAIKPPKPDSELVSFRARGRDCRGPGTRVWKEVPGATETVLSPTPGK